MPTTEPHRAEAGFALPGSVRFPQKRAVALLRTCFTVLNKISPRLAARLGLRIFLTPQRFAAPEWELELQKSAHVAKLVLGRKRVVMYSWGKGPAVVLAHAWGGRGTQLGAFVRPLLDAGMRVVAFDAPAHGASSGKHTDMIEFARTIRAVTHHVDSVHAVIGHSFGAANTLLAIRDHGLRVPKLVLIGCFAHAIWVIDTFGQHLNISRAVVGEMRRLLEQRHNNELDWESLSVAEMARRSEAPILFVHDKDDHEVPYTHALNLHAATPSSNLYTTRGNGHRRILRDPEVVMKVLEFIQGKKTSTAAEAADLTGKF